MSEARVKAATGDAPIVNTSAPPLIPCYSVAMSQGVMELSRRRTAHLSDGADPDRICAVQDLHPGIESKSLP